MVGKVVGRYGGEEYIAVDVRFPNGRHRLFWPSDLEEISPTAFSVAPSRGWWEQGLEMEELTFPTFDHYLDLSDPDVVLLRRQDGSFVAAFSARGATEECIIEAAKEDRRKWIGTHTIDYIVRDRLGGELGVGRVLHGGR
jgi:hypothetical protein